MVESQIRCGGVIDADILHALVNVPRELFVPSAKRAVAYVDEDIRLTAGDEETPPRYLIEPLAFAKLLEAAEILPSDLVLIVGCGMGYSAAVSARLAEAVIALEEDATLADKATTTLTEIGADNAAVVQGPLAEGCAGQGPYDVILIEGRAEEIPPALFEQLKDGGRLVAIVGTAQSGHGKRYLKADDVVSEVDLFDAVVQPLPGFQRKPAFSFA